MGGRLLGDHEGLIPLPHHHPVGVPRRVAFLLDEAVVLGLELLLDDAVGVVADVTVCGENKKVKKCFAVILKDIVNSS